MNVYEGGPTPPKVRVTKAQLRKIQQNYEFAQEKAVDFKAHEEAEKRLAEIELERKLKDI